MPAIRPDEPDRAAVATKAPAKAILTGSAPGVLREKLQSRSRLVIAFPRRLIRPTRESSPTVPARTLFGAHSGRRLILQLMDQGPAGDPTPLRGSESFEFAVGIQAKKVLETLVSVSDSAPALTVADRSRGSVAGHHSGKSLNMPGYRQR